jgi:Zn-dependent membrane protease YugP
MTGADIARSMLKDNGISGVKVIPVQGALTDHYNPKTRTVSLGESVYNSSSIAAAAVAAHECGHAVQHARAYAPLELRSALVPAISFASTFSTWVVLVGILLINTMPLIFWAGIAMIAAGALFSLITLPVEFNASARAMEWLKSSRTINEEEVAQARVPLKWAALTYFVAALAAIVTLLYYLGFARRS